MQYQYLSYKELHFLIFIVILANTLISMALLINKFMSDAEMKRIYGTEL
jgi:hypothetical protein